MRVPKAFPLLVFVLTLPTPSWAQPGMAVSMLTDPMISARLSELERIQASILSEPWSAETANRLRDLEGILKGFNAPGQERRVSLLLSKCNRALQMARLDSDDDNKGHQSYWYAYSSDENNGTGGAKGHDAYWPVYRADNDDVIPIKGEKSYWGVYAPDEQSQQKGTQSYWGNLAFDEDPPPPVGDQSKGSQSYWDLDGRI